MSQLKIDERMLKEALKEALTETLEERRDLFRQIFTEVLEELALIDGAEEREMRAAARRRGFVGHLNGEA